MKSRVFLSAAFSCVLALCLGVQAWAKADFSGTWTLDKSRTEGLPPGMDQVMTIVQSGDTVRIETKLITAEGEQTVTDNYTLNNQETDFTPSSLSGEKGKGRRTAKWAADGNGIEVSEHATFDSEEGEIKIKATRRWSLSQDGKTLVIIMNVEGPQGAQTLRRTFVKK